MLLNFLLTYSNLYGFIGRASPVLDTDAEAPEFDSGMRNIIIPRDYPLYRHISHSSVEGTKFFCVVFVACDCSYLLDNRNQQFSDGNQGEGKLESKWIWIESMNPCT